MVNKSRSKSLSPSLKKEALENFIAETNREVLRPLKQIWGSSKKLVDKCEGRDFEYIGYKEFKEIMRVLGTMRDQAKHCVDSMERLSSRYKRNRND